MSIFGIIGLFLIFACVCIFCIPAMRLEWRNYKTQQGKLIQAKRKFIEEWREENKQLVMDWMKDYKNYREKLIQEGKDPKNIDDIAIKIQEMDNKWEKQYQEELNNL